jgi:hypothetical protein
MVGASPLIGGYSDLFRGLGKETAGLSTTLPRISYRDLWRRSSPRVRQRDIGNSGTLRSR